MKINTEDIINKKAGNLTVIKVLPFNEKNTLGRNIYYYECLCDCGRTLKKSRKFLMNTIKSNCKSSCGCLYRISGAQNPCFKGFEQIGGRWWSNIKRSATIRNITFNITIEQAWQQAVKQNFLCNLTGANLVFAKKIINKSFVSGDASLDRIDNTKGYELHNIQWTKKDINMMKSTHTPERFLELCCMVADHGRKEK